MTPSQRLEKQLNEKLRAFGMKITTSLDWPKGGQRQMDTCRWNAGVGNLTSNNRQTLWSMASWSTISDCLKYGFSIDLTVFRGEADIMVEAEK